MAKKEKLFVTPMDITLQGTKWLKRVSKEFNVTMLTGKGWMTKREIVRRKKETGRY